MCQKFAIFATGTSDSTPVLKRLLTYIVIALSYLSMGAYNYVPHHDVYGRGMESRGDLSLVPFRYQGQYEDAETGLYYNRFRYYSPQMGMYISSDPIGLAGNNPTLYGYVCDINVWVDLFGLKNYVTAILTVGEDEFSAKSRTIHLPEGEFREIVSEAKTAAELSDLVEGIVPKPFYGNCAEINVIQKALDSNVRIEDLRGAKIYTYITATNDYIPPCKCCQRVLDKLGIIAETEHSSNLKTACH